MNQNKTSRKASFWQLPKAEWHCLLIGSMFCFFYASFLLSGKAGIIPQLDYPFVYGEDANFISLEIQRLLEGWLFNNSRSGYPFGSNFLDYPLSDNGSLVILKLFGLLTGTFYGALNLYILTGFALCFLVSFLVLKSFSFRPIYAFTAAILFTFAPFHLWRLFAHIYYSWYFVVPLYFFYGWKIFTNDSTIWPLKTSRKLLILLGILIILSSFGAYFALFGVITFIICGLASCIKFKKTQGLYASIILSSMLSFGVGLNILPNLIYNYEKGQNQEIGNRPLNETETYSLKLAPLFFPQWNHRVQRLRTPLEHYLSQFADNETAFSSSLGFVASLGLVVLLFSLFSAALGKQIDLRLGLLSILVLAFFLISSVGGLNVFFALYISPLIRGWNRISIFISFAALTALFLVLQTNKKLESVYERNKLLFYSIALSILCIGLIDQTPFSFTPQTTAAKNNFIADRKFINQIESLLPPESAIYQLPYISFPEHGPSERLADYALAGGFINSKTLRWSYASIKGREGDYFYRYLAKEPLAKQLKVIKRLGFSGIYIDRRGYSDNAQALIEELNQLLSAKPTLVKEDDQVVFYRLNPTANLLSRASPRKIMEQAGYYVSTTGPSYEIAIDEGIDFSRSGLPNFITKSRGLSGIEEWGGRWSDANLNPSVRFDFAKPLPNIFNLKLSLKLFGPNLGNHLKIIVGSQVYYLKLGSKTDYALAVDLKGETTKRIEFVPPNPTSPALDRRKISVGFARLKIESKTKSG
ncbi:MAG: sugar translocase [Tatlockia sp.]|nr:sugar translocase [Tatlockia sp.]